MDKIEPRLKAHYTTTVQPKLREEFGFTNPHQVPKLVKIVLNVGMGEAASDQKLLESVLEELGIISGQKANVNRAKKSIANFKLREGMPVGASVTLRGDRMWFFLDRLISTAVPRIRDFRGLPSKSFDGRGNYTMGIREQIIFPEIDFDSVKKIHGMDLTFVTSTDKDDEGFALLRELGMPFRGQVPIMIGATVVAYGTTTPELFVSVDAALSGSPGISIGNVVGSNIFNVLAILGLAVAAGAELVVCGPFHTTRFVFTAEFRR